MEWANNKEYQNEKTLIRLQIQSAPIIYRKIKSQNTAMESVNLLRIICGQFQHKYVPGNWYSIDWSLFL